MSTTNRPQIPSQESNYARESNCKFGSNSKIGPRSRRSLKPLVAAGQAEGDQHLKPLSFSVRQRLIQIMTTTTTTTEASREKLCSFKFKTDSRAGRSKSDDQIGTGSMNTTTTTVCDSTRERAISELNAANENCHISSRCPSQFEAMAVNNDSDDYGNYGEVPTTRHCHPTESDAKASHNHSGQHQASRQAFGCSLIDRGVARNATVLLILVAFFVIVIEPLRPNWLVTGQSLNSDPRPTIYSGQISFGLLLSAHSRPGADISTAASELVDDIEHLDPIKYASVSTASNCSASVAAAAAPERSNETLLETEASTSLDWSSSRRWLTKRQIFERPTESQVKRQQRQKELELKKQQAAAKAAKQQSASLMDSACSQANPDALYAGMGAIWASHQANLVGDSQLAIGTYVYDSCNDLEIGQRQSVRIVSNLNAFQQTTCEAPRGSPISLTIAHGENQLRAIQLLTSFKVPVITTREPFALEDYQLLSRDQRRFLFSTAPSSRHLAAGALKFAKRVVARSAASPKLPNQHHKMSSRNGLIVISRNLPAKFIAHLVENIPNQVNYEMIQTSQPIEQVRSVETLETLLMQNSATSGATTTASGQSESRLSIVRMATATNFSSTIRRRKRNDDQDQSSGGGSSSDPSDSDSNESPGGQQHRMLSPTILMFITPAEAMDLITRLRNDLADVSRYYSLIVTTREDISPALKTIFHKGGSHLCSGKAFHMISPKPDEVSEFSRYFRDTVSMEGESSDHPLICEFSKHQASSRTDSDLDDISTEAVIKAVWSAAAAFKLVYKRECAAAPGASGPNQMAPSSSGPSSDPGSQQYEQMATTSTRATKLQGRRQSQMGLGKGAGLTPHAECLIKMNKNMSNLVRNALKKLDVYINSTGLQSLDGFRIKFDDYNELLTNRYSIKYVNKECEITELGLYSGSNESQLVMDEDVLLKSLESTVPDPWPVTTPPPPAPSVSSGTPTLASGKTQADTSNSGGSAAATAANANQDETSGSSDDSNSPGGAQSKGGGGDDDQELNTQIDNEKQPSSLIENETPKRKRSNFKLAKRKIQTQELLIKQQPVAMLNSAKSTSESKFRLPKGLTDSSPSDTPGTIATAPPTTRRMTTNGPSLPMVLLPVTTSLDRRQPGRKLKPFPLGESVNLKHWLPRGHTDIQTASDEPLSGVGETTTSRPHINNLRPTRLPESDGNTDLDMPAFKNSPTTTTTTTRAPKTSSSSQATIGPNSSKSERSSPDKMTFAASTTELSTDTGDYVTLPSIARTSSQLGVSPIDSQASVDAGLRPYAIGSYPQVGSSRREPRFGFLRELSNSPLLLNSNNSNNSINTIGSNSSSGTSRSRLRSHLKWINGSWFTLTILGANICGALLTLYVLTFLLVKNFDGSFDHGNQGLRSIHLLSVIVVFFGSTLFIVYPTPSLCLLRSSWHNFALVLLFGSLLLQTMQTRSVSSIGLGGRPNRLNQLLTLAFMVGVQVATELQRWKYESANYVNFVNQYLNSPEDGDKKLLALSSSIGSQFNPLNSFNDQVTPVSIQVSERYQNLLHDYCSQPVEDFLQSQFYLWIIMALLVAFSITNRRQMGGQCKTSGAGQTTSKSAGGLLAKARGGRRDTAKFNAADKTSTQSNYALTSGKLLASQHETNELAADRLSPSARSQAFGSSVPFSMGSKAAAKRLHSTTTDVFTVALISVPIYLVSVVLRVHGQSSLIEDHHDLVASVTMILIAFAVLLGIFLPLLKNHHRFGELVSGPVSPASSSTVDAKLERPILGISNLTQTRKRASALYGAQAHSPAAATSTAFAMFPEFASTGLRRPSSIGADSLGRRPFSETKESRRNMGLSLANLPPEPDSLRNLCIHSHRSSVQISQHHRAGLPNESCSDQRTPNSTLNLKLAGVDEEPQMHDEHQREHHHQINEPPLIQKSYKLNNHHHHHHHHHQQQQQQQHRRSQPSASSRRSSISSAGEKRLIMLDVDPCCPRHGQNNGPNPVN